MCKIVKESIKGKDRPVCVVATNNPVASNLVNAKTMSEENDRVRKQLSDAQSEGNKKARKIEGMHDDINKLRLKVEESRQQSERAEAEMGRMRRELERSESRAKKLSNESGNLLTTIKELRANAGNAGGGGRKPGPSEAAYTKMKMNHKKLAHAVDRMSGDKKRLREKLDAAEAQIAELTGRAPRPSTSIRRERDEEGDAREALALASAAAADMAGEDEDAGGALDVGDGAVGVHEVRMTEGGRDSSSSSSGTSTDYSLNDSAQDYPHRETQEESQQQHRVLPGEAGKEHDIGASPLAQEHSHMKGFVTGNHARAGIDRSQSVQRLASGRQYVSSISSSGLPPTHQQQKLHGGDLGWTSAASMHPSVAAALARAESKVGTNHGAGGGGRFGSNPFGGITGQALRAGGGGSDGGARKENTYDFGGLMVTSLAIGAHPRNRVPAGGGASGVRALRGGGFGPRGVRR